MAPQLCLEGVFVSSGIPYLLWALEQYILRTWARSLLALLAFIADAGSQRGLVRAWWGLRDYLADSASCQLALYTYLGVCHILHPIPGPNTHLGPVGVY